MGFSKSRVKIICGITLFLLFFKEGLALAAPEPSDKDIPNVIIITLSGVRNSESIADTTHQYMPNLWNNMRVEGTVYANLVCLDQEFHMPALDAINTGRNWHIYCKIDTPSIFQYVRKKYSLPLNKLWSVKQYWHTRTYYSCAGYMNDTYPSEVPLTLVTTPELEALFTKQERLFVKSFKKLWDDFQSFRAYMWDSLDEVYYRFFKKIVREFQPKMIQLAMGGVETGHYDTFARYALSLKRSDEMIFEIWQMIQNDPFYKNNTYLIVCPDGARNLYYMHHTENPHNNPGRVWMYIYGPDIKKGMTINRPVYHRDIFATLAYIMDVKTHPNEGKALKDCFSHFNIR